eukprot:12829437-Ditylum_brightwellii.AAC.1
MKELQKSGSCSGASYRQCSRDRALYRDQQPPVSKTLLKDNMLTVFEQAEINQGNQTTPHFKLCLDDVAEHVFPEKAGQAQKYYMQRNLRLSKGITVEEWVA